MQLQFQEQPIYCLEQIKGQAQTQEQTQELRLPEGMPDIGRVLCAWGQVVVRGKQWQPDCIGVSAGVMAWVLYAPEDGSQAQCVQTWIPVTVKWDIPDCEKDGAVLCNALVRSVDARSLSGRKLMLRACVSIYARAYIPCSCQSYIPEGLPEDIQLLQRTQQVCLAMETGEKPFVIDEEVSIPTSVPAMDKLIRYSLQPEIREQKVLGDKVIFRGSALLHILYRTPEGALSSWDTELPFSQYQELERSYCDEAQTWTQPLVTALELEQGEGSLRLKAGLSGQYVIYEDREIPVVEDAYSPQRKLQLHCKTLKLPAIAQRQSQRLRAEQTGAFGSSRVADVTFMPDFGQKQRKPEELLLEVPGQFQTLYYDPEGVLQANTTAWQQELSIAAPAQATVDVLCDVAGKAQAVPTDTATVLRGEALLETVITDPVQVETVCAITAAEPEEKDPERPGVILRRAAGESLWSIAKATGSTVAAIMQANALQGQPEPDEMLLIPII